jgi:hypothetical protein
LGQGGIQSIQQVVIPACLLSRFSIEVYLQKLQLSQEWIGYDRGIKTLLNQIRKVDAKATELLLKEAVSG